MTSSDEFAVGFWVKVMKVRSPMDSPKYDNLTTLALQMLSIPASNADCEHAFSLVQRIKTMYRSSHHQNHFSSRRMPL